MKKAPLGIIILSSIWIISAVLAIISIILPHNTEQPSWLFGLTIVIAIVQILISYGLIIGDTLAWRSSVVFAIIIILLKSYLLAFSTYPNLSQDNYAVFLNAKYTGIVSIVTQLVILIYLLTPAVKKHVGLVKESYSLK